jgi:hypothetical protein
MSLEEAFDVESRSRGPDAEEAPRPDARTIGHPEPRAKCVWEPATEAELGFLDFTLRQPWRKCFTAWKHGKRQLLSDVVEGSVEAPR